MDRTVPRPSILLAVVSVVVIALNLLFVSFLIATWWTGPSFYAAFVIVFFLPISLVVAVQQYRGTFRHALSGASTMRIMSYGFSGLALFALVTNCLEGLSEGGSLRAVLLLSLIFTAIGALAFAVGRMNDLWYRRLRLAIESEDGLQSRRGFSLRELLLGVSVIAAMFGATTYIIRSEPPHYAEHVDASAVPLHLPEGAEDVSYYYFPSLMSGFECTTTEEEYRKWVEDRFGSLEAHAGVEIEEIGTPKTMLRVANFAPESTDNDRAVITNGLHYSWSFEDRGVYAVFDRDTNRLYYYSHSH